MLETTDFPLKSLTDRRRSINNLSPLYNMSTPATSAMEEREENTNTPVYLKVYDLSHGLVSDISLPLLGFHLEGIWHTSVAIYGNEYLFGSGIVYEAEEICQRHTNAPLVEKKLLGHTNITKDVFHEYIDSLKHQFSPESYDLLKWNCNNFTNVAAEFLTGSGIPEKYLTIVDKIAQSPNGRMVLSMVENSRRQDPNSFVVPGQRQ